MDAGSAFIAGVRERLGDIRQRLVTTLGRLQPEDLTWRPNEASNSVANLVIHICGNVRQRFRAGLGGAPDTRDRDAEFADRAAHTAQDLIRAVEDAFSEADAILAALPAERLAETQAVRGQARTHLAMLLTAVSHYGEHLGQILYIAKLRQGERFASLSVPLPGKR